MTDEIIDIEERRKKREPSREKRHPSAESFEQKLRRAIARGTPMRPLSPKHEAALFVWHAAACADTDPDKPADFLEMAAQRLRKGGD